MIREVSLFCFHLYFFSSLIPLPAATETSQGPKSFLILSSPDKVCMIKPTQRDRKAFVIMEIIEMQW